MLLRRKSSQSQLLFPFERVLEAADGVLNLALDFFGVALRFQFGVATASSSRDNGVSQSNIQIAAREDVSARTRSVRRYRAVRVYRAPTYCESYGPTYSDRPYIAGPPRCGLFSTAGGHQQNKRSQRGCDRFYAIDDTPVGECLAVDRGLAAVSCRTARTAVRQPRRSGARSRPRLVGRSEFAEQHQNQHDHQHKAEPAAAVVAGPVKGAATEPAKAAEQRDDENDEHYGSKRHAVVSLGRVN
jgi:hypothetical protein